MTVSYFLFIYSFFLFKATLQIEVLRKELYELRVRRTRSLKETVEERMERDKREKELEERIETMQVLLDEIMNLKALQRQEIKRMRISGDFTEGEIQNRENELEAQIKELQMALRSKLKQYVFFLDL